MLRGCNRWLLTVLLALLSAAVPNATQASSPPGIVRLPGHVLPALVKATVVPSKPGSDRQPLMLTIVLKHDDEAGFARYLHDVYDPHSRLLHRYLKQRQIAARFGPSRDDYNSVLVLTCAPIGSSWCGECANRLTRLTVRGTRGDAERAFNTRIGDYRIGSRTFQANSSDPQLPAAIAARIENVAGLSNLAQPHRVIEFNRQDSLHRGMPDSARRKPSEQVQFLLRRRSEFGRVQDVSIRRPDQLHQQVCQQQKIRAGGKRSNQGSRIMAGDEWRRADRGGLVRVRYLQPQRRG